MKPRPKFCEQCGRELPLEGKFCPGCGDSLEISESPTPVADMPSTGVSRPPVQEVSMPQPPVGASPGKPPFGVGNNYTPTPPASAQFPSTMPTPPYARKNVFTGSRPFREKRIGGGIPTILGGLSLIGSIVYAFMYNLDPSLTAPVVGLIALIVGILMLRVRNIKTFLLAFSGSMLLSVYAGYNLYLLVTTTQTVNPDAPATLPPVMVFLVIGSVFILFGFSRAFNSIFRR